MLFLVSMSIKQVRTLFNFSCHFLFKFSSYGACSNTQLLPDLVSVNFVNVSLLVIGLCKLPGSSPSIPGACAHVVASASRLACTRGWSIPPTEQLCGEERQDKMGFLVQIVARERLEDRRGRFLYIEHRIKVLCPEPGGADDALHEWIWRLSQSGTVEIVSWSCHGLWPHRFRPRPY